VTPGYTLHPDAGYEQMASEVAAAIAWTLENVDRYGGDPGRVTVAGHSAGGHLVALAAMDARFLSAYGHTSSEICGIIGLSGVYDVGLFVSFEQGNGREATDLVDVMGGSSSFARASPIHHVQGSLPPVLLIHGDDDRVVPIETTDNLYDALHKAGAQAWIEVYHGGGHVRYIHEAMLEDQARLISDLSRFVHTCPPRQRP
jgi:acetyl esterase/lipase